MPRKIKELIRSLERAGFIERSGKGSHRKFTHPKIVKMVIISGHLGDDAKAYQEKAVKLAIEELKQ
jgi:predicted RNA binding protein YcfA (HicA-like mRNA interferase family)